MSLTSQQDLHEKYIITQAGFPVVVKVPTSKTIDFTSPRGIIERDMYEQGLLAVPGPEYHKGEGFNRKFRCIVSDLPSVPLTELVVVYDGYSYQVQSFTKSHSGYTAILETTRA